MVKAPFLRRILPASTRRRRRVDACILHNEIDLLTLRMEELWDQIDYFVVVEADETLSGERKPLFFRDHQARFKRFADKLVYRSISGLPPIREPGEGPRWVREAAQREAIGHVVETLPLSPRDIVIVADVDEIPRASRVAGIETALRRHDYAIFALTNHRGYINNISEAALNGTTFAGPVACRLSTLRRVGAHQVRRGWQKSGGVLAHRSPDYAYVEDGGWHFSSLGGPDAFWLKAASFSHIDDPYRVIRLAETTPAQQVFSANLDRSRCRELQVRYLSHCDHPAFSPLEFDTFEITQDVPAFLRREKERYRGFFFFTDLVPPI
jgi:beta-1,4-mannosyl-glycoprotein beta-1,4-N-acetylglucosaminyltransferase